MLLKMKAHFIVKWPVSAKRTTYYNIGPKHDFTKRQNNQKKILNTNLILRHVVGQKPTPTVAGLPSYHDMQRHDAFY
jgi:hypothetical protein